VGQAQIQIGGQTTQARHYRLEGNDEVRELWVDGEGRVLRLEFADRGYRAEREQLP